MLKNPAAANEAKVFLVGDAASCAKSDGRAGFGSGDFYAEPAPRIRLRPPGRLPHLGKVLYEKYWLGRWF